jgi:putative ABC transport system substrate-binding protein
MVKPAKTGSRGAWALWAGISALGLLALPGCSSKGTPALTPKPVKLARAQQVAVIRLGDPAIEEPSNSDIADGLRYAGLDASSFALEDHDAKGDLAAVAGLVDAATGGGADLLITCLPETTMAAAGRERRIIPLVFTLTGNPFALGLGTSDSEHQPNLTGAYTPFHQSLLVPIARGCLPKARKFGIPFNPDDRYSVIHKDALLRTGWQAVEPVTAEFHSDSEVPAAIRALIDQKAEAVILVTGIGKAAPAAIAEARRAKVPVFGFRAEHARAGAIVAKEPTMRWGAFEAGRRAGRILLGEPAGQIPFTQGVAYVTYVNTGAAKDLGVAIFGDLMRNARVVSSQ